MHEASIAVALIERLSAHPDLAGKRVRAVRLRVGRLSTVVPENLTFVFGPIAEGTPLEGAVLEIEEVPARAACESCGRVFELDEPFFVCPGCGSGKVRIESGRELEIDGVDVE